MAFGINELFGFISGVLLAPMLHRTLLARKPLLELGCMCMCIDIPVNIREWRKVRPGNTMKTPSRVHRIVRQKKILTNTLMIKTMKSQVDSGLYPSVDMGMVKVVRQGNEVQTCSSSSWVIPGQTWAGMTTCEGLGQVYKLR